MHPPTQAVAGVTVLAAVVTLVVLTSCRQVIAIGDPDPPPSCHAPDFQGGASCGDCLVDRCCAELDACRGDAACGALLECVAACGDDACRAACETTSTLSEPSAALLACQAGRCEGSCGLTCGGAGPPVTGCKPCGAVCCAEGAAVRSDLDGQRLRACRATCKPKDVGCAEACINAHARGADLERIARDCVVRTCGVVGDWSCVGRVEPRKAKVGTLSITVTASDFQYKALLADVTVKGCSNDDLTCATPPYGTSITKADGVAKISVALSAITGLDAYPGFLELTREGYVPQLVYFAPALVADSAIGVSLVPTALATQVGQLAGVPLAADRGALTMQLRDCAQRLGPGVSIHADTQDSASRTFYLASASAAGGAIFDFGAQATSEVGLGGVFNVPTGPAKLTTRLEQLCVEPAVASVAVRAGALTLVVAGPTP